MSGGEWYATGLEGVLVHVVLGGWRSIEGRPLRREQAGLFATRSAADVGRKDRPRCNKQRQIRRRGPAQTRAVLRQPAGRLLRPESKMTI